jgi:UDP-2-acetamido-2-deoxy-ribo-hexuluronate aminotransferase
LWRRSDARGAGIDPALTSPVPFVDLRSEWEPLRQEVLDRIARIFEHGRFIGGPEITDLEECLSGITGVEHTIACGSGTTALLASLLALDLEPDDEVIVPAFTFAAPLECVLLVGARPVLVDVDYPSGLISLDAIEQAMTRKTRTIVAVSLFGTPPDFTAIKELVSGTGITVIEDAAQSLGAVQNGTASGGLCDIACTSFFPTKTLGGAGDGGAIFTNNAELAGRVREIRNHGQSDRYRHVRLGLNGRMSSIAAAALLARLDGLPPALEARRRIGAVYDEAFEPLRRKGLTFATVPAGIVSARSQYAIALCDRDAAAAALAEVGIETAVHYPLPLHLQPAFAGIQRAGGLDQAERLANEVLCLPIYPGLTATNQQRVIGAIGSYVERGQT